MPARAQKLGGGPDGTIVEHTTACWIHAKLSLVAQLIAYHIHCGKLLWDLNLETPVDRFVGDLCH